MVLSVTFLLTSVSTIQESLLARDLAFRTLETRLMAATVVGAVVGIGAAALGWGAWAVILQSLTLSLCSSALLWAMSPWRPRLSLLVGVAALDGVLQRLPLRPSPPLLPAPQLRQPAHRQGDRRRPRWAPTRSPTTSSSSPSAGSRPRCRTCSSPPSRASRATGARIADGWIRVTRAVAAVSIPALAGLALVADDFVDRRPRAQVERRGARHPDPGLGRRAAGAAEPQHRDPRGPRPRPRDLPLDDRLLRLPPRRVRRRPALGDARRRRRLRDLHDASSSPPTSC